MSQLTGVLTYHNDPARTGVIFDTGVNPAVVGNPQWGLLRRLPLDAAVYAQPLFVYDVLRPDGAVRHVLLIATARNALYAFDGSSYELLWMTLLGQPDSTDVMPPFDKLACGHISPGNIQTDRTHMFIGIQSTPVIDADTDRVYVSYRVGGLTAAQARQWLAAVDLSTGSVLLRALAEPPGGPEVFNIRDHRQRASLLLSQGLVYVAFASRCEDSRPDGSPIPRYHGWVVVHDAKTLRQVATFNSTPTSAGGGIWQASGGLAADAQGRVYFITGNTQDGVGADMRPDPTGQNLGNSFVRLDVTATRDGNGAVTSATVNAGSWFMPYRAEWQNSIDLDLGSAGPVLIPGTNYVAGGGKEGILYLLDRDNLGGLGVAPPSALPQLPPQPNEPYAPNNPKHDHSVAETQAGVNQTVSPTMDDWPLFPHIHGAPVCLNSAGGAHMLYVWAEKDFLKGIAVEGESLHVALQGPDLAPQATPGGLAAMPGGMLSAAMDSHRPGSGIIFASAPQDPAGEVGALRAYEATTLHRIWESPETRDKSYRFAKFAPPTIADARVFLPTFSNQILVYGRGDFWQGPIRFGRAVYPREAAVSVSHQSADQLTAVIVDNNGSLSASWVVADGPWAGPVPIGAPNFPPGAPVALAQQTQDQMVALAVDIYGRLNVAWVAGTGAWAGPVPISGTIFPPGAHIALDHQGSMDQLDALVVDRFGAVQVMWVHGLEGWQGPQPLTAPNFTQPGAHIALDHQGSMDQLDALVVDRSGAINVLWVNGLANWAGPARISPSTFGPGASIAMAGASAKRLTALAVDTTGRINVMWVMGP